MQHVAMGLLIDPQGRVLLGRRSPSKAILPGKWDAIGGRVEPGETVEAALVREIQEELGVLATQFALLESGPQYPQDGARYWLSLFAVTEWEGAPDNASDEHDAIAWFTAEAAKVLGPSACRDYAPLVLMVLASRS